MWRQCGEVGILLTFGFLLLASGQQDLEEELQSENEDLVMEVEGNETDSVEEEMVGQDELEDLHLEVGRRLLVEGGLEVTLLRAGQRCRRKAVNGDLVAIQYEGRLEGEEGSVFHATEPRQPFVFVVTLFSLFSINRNFLLTQSLAQVEAGRALPGLVAGVYQMLTMIFLGCSVPNSSYGLIFIKIRRKDSVI